MSLSVHPVLKWTGSKRRLVPAIHALTPRCYRVYREPFLGSGVVFFNVTARAPAVLSDCLPEVMAIHQAVKDRPLEMLRQIYEHLENLRRIGPRYYYTVRDAFNQTRDLAALVFLTRTSYWGLVRFNEAGEFNVAFHAGRFPRLNGLKRHILAQSYLLRRATLLAMDYGEALADATEGDWIYLDPPSHILATGRCTAHRGSSTMGGLLAYCPISRGRAARFCSVSRGTSAGEARW